MCVITGMCLQVMKLEWGFQGEEVERGNRVSAWACQRGARGAACGKRPAQVGRGEQEQMRTKYSNTCMKVT